MLFSYEKSRYGSLKNTEIIAKLLIYHTTETAYFESSCKINRKEKISYYKKNSLISCHFSYASTFKMCVVENSWHFHDTFKCHYKHKLWHFIYFNTLALMALPIAIIDFLT